MANAAVKSDLSSHPYFYGIINQPTTMDDKTIQINTIKRQIGTLLSIGGIKQVEESISDFTDTEGDFARFCKPLFGLPVSEMDSKYYFTSFDNWRKIVDTINPITKAIPWEAERRDCDKRAMLVTAMVSMYFGINTCRPMYCDVYRVSDGQYAYTHYANVFVDDAGNAWLWDADEFGQITKITGQNPVINNKRYVLRAVR